VDFAELDAITQQLFALYDEQREISVPVEHSRSVWFAHGWYRRCRRLSEALLELSHLGYSHEAAPMRRSLVEHSAFLLWLAEAPDGAVDSLLWKHQKRIGQMRAAMRGEWPVPEEAFDVLDITVAESSERTYLAFAHLCQRFQLQEIYVVWLTETGLTHPSFSSAAAYTGADDLGEAILVNDAPQDLVPDRAVVPALLCLASKGMNAILAEHPWTDTLEEIERRLAEAVGNQAQSESDM
jgi:hypothetical protein